MDSRLNHIDELIAKHLAGEATEEEIIIVEDFSAQSAANKRYVDQFRMIFDRAAQINTIQKFDTDNAWSKVRSNLKKKGKQVPFNSKGSGLSILWKVAASIIILFGIGLFLVLQKEKEAYTTITKEVVAKKEAVTDTLPNGSAVFLNKETKLTYAYDKKKKTHTVGLKGEAYFNVKHADEETFLIRINDIFIEDIGTSFNVKAYPDSNTIEVLVEEGEVIFYTAKDQGIHLRDTGKGVYNKVTKKFTIEQPEPNVTAYKTKFFIFSGTDLKTVSETLNSVYSKKIVVSDSVKNCLLTVSFKDENIDEIARVIAETLSLKIHESEGKLILEGTGCE